MSRRARGEPREEGERESGLDTIISRVRSWLRINAGGVLNTFKSNGVCLEACFWTYLVADG